MKTNHQQSNTSTTSDQQQQQQHPHHFTAIKKFYFNNNSTSEEEQPQLQVNNNSTREERQDKIKRLSSFLSSSSTSTPAFNKQRGTSSFCTKEDLINFKPIPYQYQSLENINNKTNNNKKEENISPRSSNNNMRNSPPHQQQQHMFEVDDRSSPSSITMSSQSSRNSSMAVNSTNLNNMNMNSNNMMMSPGLSRHSSTNSLKDGSNNNNNATTNINPLLAGGNRNPLAGFTNTISSNNNNNNNNNTASSTGRVVSASPVPPQSNINHNDSGDSMGSLPRYGHGGTPTTTNRTNNSNIPSSSAFPIGTSANTISGARMNSRGQQQQQQQHQQDLEGSGSLPAAGIVLGNGTAAMIGLKNPNNNNNNNNTNNNDNNNAKRSSTTSTTMPLNHSTTSFDERAASIRPPNILSPNQRTIEIPDHYNNNKNQQQSPTTPWNNNSHNNDNHNNNHNKKSFADCERRSGTTSCRVSRCLQCMCCLNLVSSTAPNADIDENQEEEEMAAVDAEVSRDLRDWSTYYNAPRGVGHLITPWLRLWSERGRISDIFFGLLQLGLIAAGLVLFLLDDSGMNHPQMIPIVVLLASPALYVIGTVMTSIRLASNLDNWVAKAVQLTIMSALTEPSYYRVFLCGLRQTDARILWAADSLSKAAPFLDQELVEEICQGPPPELENQQPHSSSVFLRSPHNNNNNNNNNSPNRQRRNTTDDTNRQRQHNNIDTHHHNDNDFCSDESPPRNLDGTLKSCDAAEMASMMELMSSNNVTGMLNNIPVHQSITSYPVGVERQQQQQQHRSFSRGSQSTTTTHIDGAGDDVDSDLSSISSDDDDESCPTEEGNSGATTSSSSRPRSDSSKQNQTQQQQQQRLLLHAATSDVSSNQNQIPQRTISATSSSTGNQGTQRQQSSNLSSIASTSASAANTGGLVSPPPVSRQSTSRNSISHHRSESLFSQSASWRSDVVMDDVNNSGNQSGALPAGIGSHKSMRQQQLKSSFRSAASIARITANNGHAFATSKIPYQNTAQPRNVVVAHFAFYFNRHGSQRPPPAMSANEIVREFVTHAISCVTKFKGQIYSIQPNAVVGYWEVGGSSSPTGSTNNSSHHHHHQPASSQTCEYNACAASKEFAKVMKIFKMNALQIYQEKLNAMPANNKNQQQTSHTLHKALKSFRGSSATTNATGGGGFLPTPQTSTNNNGAFGQSAMDMFNNNPRTPRIAATTASSSSPNNNNHSRHNSNSSNSNINSNESSQSLLDANTIGILARANFTVGVTKGTVMKGNLGTQQKASSQLFGPVVQKAAVLAEVGVKCQASVVLSYSIYSSNNMNFTMRPIEDIEVPKWLSEGKLGGRLGGALVSGAAASREQPAVTPFRVTAMTPNPLESHSFSTAAAANQQQPQHEGSSSNSSMASPSASASSANVFSGNQQQQLTAHQRRVAAARQRDQQLGTNEIETVYQLLSVKNSDDDDTGGTTSKENEWMYLLERHGGAELHDMSTAFNAFKSGNLNQAAGLYLSLAVKARDSNMNDRYVAMRLKQLQPILGGGGGQQHQQQQHGNSHHHGEDYSKSGGESEDVSCGNETPTANDSAGGVLRTVLHDVRHTSSSRNVFSANSNTNNNNSPQQQHGGGGGGSGQESGKVSPSPSNVRNSNNQMINPRRQALDIFFDDLRMTGLRYSRRVHVTGVDDFPFE